MTEKFPGYKLGDVVRGYVLTEDGWVPSSSTPEPEEPEDPESL
jgi:hypothetical protein